MSGVLERSCTYSPSKSSPALALHQSRIQDLEVPMPAMVLGHAMRYGMCCRQSLGTQMVLQESAA